MNKPIKLQRRRRPASAALEVPESLEVSATCVGEDGAEVVMGVRHRSLPLEGVQFHPESVLSQQGAALVANFLGRPSAWQPS